MPDVQKPHWAAFNLINAPCSGAQGAIRRQPFDGVDPFSVHLRRKHEAAARRAPVDQNRTGTARTVFAAQMRAGEFDLLAQEIGKMLPRLHARFDALSVDCRFQFR